MEMTLEHYARRGQRVMSTRSLVPIRHSIQRWGDALSAARYCRLEAHMSHVLDIRRRSWCGVSAAKGRKIRLSLPTCRQMGGKIKLPKVTYINETSSLETRAYGLVILSRVSTRQQKAIATFFPYFLSDISFHKWGELVSKIGEFASTPEERTGKSTP